MRLVDPIQEFRFFERVIVQPPQLLKWVGNKQRFAKTIVSLMPQEINKYIEPFVGTGAVLGALQPSKAIIGDNLGPLIGLWELVRDNPDLLEDYYEKMWYLYHKDKHSAYDLSKSRYNFEPNPLDLLFISRTCYGGVMRFTKEGKISTPIGPHNPIPPEKFASRLSEWHRIVKSTQIHHQSFEKTMELAGEGDLVYCDPPYLFSQSILYGSQGFNVKKLWESIKKCKERGAKVMLSIDGSKKSGNVKLKINMPDNLFERELFVDCGRSMLRRFQKKGETLIDEDVHDRLLLTW